MAEEDLKGLPPPDADLRPELLEAVNQLVWLIADEFVDAYQEAIWLREMLPDPEKPKTRTAGEGSAL